MNYIPWRTQFTPSQELSDDMDHTSSMVKSKKKQAVPKGLFI